MPSLRARPGVFSLMHPASGATAEKVVYADPKGHDGTDIYKCDRARHEATSLRPCLGAHVDTS